MRRQKTHSPLIPAKAASPICVVQRRPPWIPAFAGMSGAETIDSKKCAKRQEAE
jgi:hypothetical protein